MKWNVNMSTTHIDISFHLKFHVILHFLQVKSVIWHFMSFDVSCHLTFLVIWRFLSFDVSSDSPKSSWHLCSKLSLRTHSYFVKKFKIGNINRKTLLTLFRPFRASEHFWPHWSRKGLGGPNIQIQIHKYTNTVWSNLHIDPTSAMFLAPQVL